MEMEEGRGGGGKGEGGGRKEGVRKEKREKGDGERKLGGTRWKWKREGRRVFF